MLGSGSQKGAVFSIHCPSRKVLKHVTSQWGVLVLCALLTGTHRFSQLRRKIEGISEKMLTQTLKTFEEDGLLLRVSYPVIPPHVEYTLTPAGLEVATRIQALTLWIEDNWAMLLKPTEEGDARAALQGCEARIHTP